jgi:16S rRNA U516 pseudouridylate synthase RsuA-like enzyme
MHGSFPPSDHPRNRVLRVRLTDEEHARLRAVAAAQGRPVAELVRSAIRFTALGRRQGGTGNA